jgi:dTMP kinase
MNQKNLSTVPLPLLIAIEGCEGTGKSTLSKNLAVILSKTLDREVVTIASPARGALREIIVNQDPHNPLNVNTETLLLLADRYEVMTKQVIPALKQNKIVILDRWIHSTVALQGVMRGNVVQLMKFLQADPHLAQPADITLMLDAPVEVMTERLKNRSTGNQFDVDFSPEKSANAYQTAAKILQAYLKYDEDFVTVKTVQATGTPEDVMNNAISALCDCIHFQAATVTSELMLAREMNSIMNDYNYLKRIAAA